jgi:hypothetical protein
LREDVLRPESETTAREAAYGCGVVRIEEAVATRGWAQQVQVRQKGEQGCPSSDWPNSQGSSAVQAVTAPAAKTKSSTRARLLTRRIATTIAFLLTLARSEQT